MMMDLPAPVSPVSTLKPGDQSMRSASMIAKSWMDNSARYEWGVGIAVRIRLHQFREHPMVEVFPRAASREEGRAGAAAHLHHRAVLELVVELPVDRDDGRLRRPDLEPQDRIARHDEAAQR